MSSPLLDATLRWRGQAADHELLEHRGPAQYCMDCRIAYRESYDPEQLYQPLDPRTDEDERVGRHVGSGHRGPAEDCLTCRAYLAGDEARFALTVRGWAATADEDAPWTLNPDAERILREQPGGAMAPDGVEQHAFSKAAEPVLQRALDLVTERGGTHGDTWRLPMETTYVDHVLALEDGVISHSQAWKRLLICAAFVDMKSARFQRGEWKPDDIEDGINYAACFRTWRSEYDDPEATDAILDHHRESRTAG